MSTRARHPHRRGARSSDWARILKALQEAGPRGLHTHDIRQILFSGNPSQRIKELESQHGCTILHKREPRNGRPGCRYILVGPPGAGGSTEPKGSPAPPLVGEAAAAGRGWITDEVWDFTDGPCKVVRRRIDPKAERRAASA